MKDRGVLGGLVIIDLIVKIGFIKFLWEWKQPIPIFCLLSSVIALTWINHLLMVVSKKYRDCGEV